MPMPRYGVLYAQGSGCTHGGLGMRNRLHESKTRRRGSLEGGRRRATGWQTGGGGGRGRGGEGATKYAPQTKTGGEHMDAGQHPIPVQTPVSSAANRQGMAIRGVGVRSGEGGFFFTFFFQQDESERAMVIIQTRR